MEYAAFIFSIKTGEVRILLCYTGGSKEDGHSDLLEGEDRAQSEPTGTESMT